MKIQKKFILIIPDKKIYPAIDITKSGTMDAVEFINSKLKETKSNADFFNSMNKPAQLLEIILFF